MSKKRLHAPSSPESELIEIYEDLSSLDEAVRLRAAQALVVKHVQSGTFRDQNVLRILRRLLRGLSSGRKAARIGFSIALTESLTRVCKNSGQAELDLEVPATLFRNLKEQTDVNIQSSKQEGRDHYHGQLFGITALIRSGIFFLQTDGGSDLWGDVISFVLELASKKSWLREECGFMLFTLIKDTILPHDSLGYADILVHKLRSQHWLYTPEGVAIWLVLQDVFPKVSLPDGVWHRNTPLDRKEKNRLAKILTGANDSLTPPDEDQVHPVDGRWSPNVHFAWQAVVSRLFAKQKAASTSKTNTSKLLQFGVLWEATFDRIIFVPKSSQEKKYKGLLLFQHCIATIPARDVSVLFTPNFVKCFIDHLAAQDRYLHRASDKARKILLKRSAEDPIAALPILQGLLSGLDGDFDLDSKTKTKTMEDLLLNAAKCDADSTVTMLNRTVLPKKGDSEAEITRQRLVVATAIVAVFRRIHDKTQCTNQSQVFIRRALFLLGSWAYSDQTIISLAPQNDVPPTSQSSRTQLNARIASCFSHVLGQRSDAANVIYNFYCDVRSQAPSLALLGAQARANRTAVKLVERSLDTTIQAWERSSRSDVGSAFQQAMVVLLGMTLLTLLGGDSDSVPILEDLLQILGPQSTPMANIDEPASLVQILLSLVSKPSLLLRRTVNQVFATITSLLDEEALLAFLAILNTKEGSAGQASLFDSQHDEDDREEADSDDSGSARKENGNIGVCRNRLAEGDASGISDSDPGLNDEDQQEDDAELVEFERKLANALGTRPRDSSEVASGESSSGEDMDDDQMELIDQSLQNMFKERKNATNRKQEQKGAKDLIINFKCRVLELLEIYVKSESHSPRSLSLLIPLLTLIRTTSSPVVSRKGCDVIKIYFHVCKGEKLLRLVDDVPAMDILRSVHEEARQPASNAHINACSQASLLLARVIAAYNRDCLRQVIEIYGATQEAAMFDPTVRYKVSFFVDWLNWSQSMK